MSDKEEIVQAISDLRSDINLGFTDINLGFKSINKRLDGIENELRKIDTVLGYSNQYDNIPS
ncbi:hypothetical protein [Aquimarina sp. RZ0]|uniref:hypothetical protein n=1 Tax=Aquimarina sp. RZ0 TaxID=2607730 RepID=UPI0011F14BF9|nr:hypothetical protein [Aquimarina sp. RZ0]KAA1246203.1 hypothetical protein F0000_08685 [Aquimarina sp. RZ0]